MIGEKAIAFLLSSMTARPTVPVPMPIMTGRGVHGTVTRGEQDGVIAVRN